MGIRGAAFMFALTIALAGTAALEARQPAGLQPPSSPSARAAWAGPPTLPGPSRRVAVNRVDLRPALANSFGAMPLQGLMLPFAQSVSHQVPLCGEALSEGLMLVAWFGDFLLEPAHIWALAPLLFGLCLGLRLTLPSRREAPGRRA